MPVAVNLGAPNLLDLGLLGDVQEVLDKHAVDPSMLQQLAMMVRAEVVKVEQRGASPVVVTARPLRRPLRRLLALTEVRSPVLSPDELGPQVRVETAGVVMLETESALWPKARVASKSRKSAVIPPAKLLICQTTNPSNKATAAVTQRRPNRSIAQPAGKQASAPKRVAHKFRFA